MRQMLESAPRKLVLAACLGVLVGCSQDRSPDEYVSEARRHIASGAYSAATVELNNALQADPQNGAARWLSAQVALSLGDGPKAERDAKRALEQGTPISDVQPVLIRALFLQADLDRVLTETSVPLQDVSDTVLAELRALRGKALLFKGELESAQQELGAALTLDPNSAEALYGSGLLSSARGDLAGAREWAQKALGVQPLAPDPWTLIGDLDLEAGEYEAAEAALTKAIDNRAFVTLDRAKRAFARVRLGKFNEADADLRFLSQNRLDHYYADYVRGILAFRQGQLTEAANAFEASLNRNANFAPNRVYLATTRLLLGQLEQAVSHAEFIRRIAPQSARAARLLGVVQMNRADFGAAKEVLESILQTQPDDTTTLQMLVSTSMLSGDHARALDYAHRLATLEPDSEEVRNVLMLAQLVSGQTLSTTASASGDAAYRAQFIEALAAFRDNRFGQSRTAVQELRDRHPDQTDPIKLSAAIHLAVGQWAEARRDLETVIERTPGDADTRKNLARIELQEGNPQRVRDLLQPLATVTPIDEAALILMSDAESRLGNHEQAVRLLEDALVREPTAYAILATLARLHLSQGEAPKALNRLRGLSGVVMAQRPVLFELLGRAQLDTGDISAARSTFESWTKASPRSGPAHFWLAEGHGRAGERQPALDALFRSLELAPNYLPARIGELKLLTLSGDLKKAGEAAGRLDTQFGPTREVLGVTGWHALVTGNFKLAEGKLREAFRLAPDSELVTLIARALWGQGKHDEAFTFLNDWLSGRPGDVAALLYLAGAHLTLQQEDKAVAAYRRVLQHQPNHVPSMNNVAWLTRKDNPAEALKLARRAYELAPDDPFVLDTLGMLHLEQKDLLQASWLVRQAVERNPNDPQLRLHLSQILVEQGNVIEARGLLREILASTAGTPLNAEAASLLQRIGE